MINGTGSKPFNMATLPPPDGGSAALAAQIRELSRMKFGRPRAEVEKELTEGSLVAEKAKAEREAVLARAAAAEAAKQTQAEKSPAAAAAYPPAAAAAEDPENIPE